MDSDALQQKITDFINKHNTCALAVANGDFVRCTPIEYNYMDGSFYLLSEGGLKFKALKDNKNVCLAIYEEYKGFGKLNGLQVTGMADMVEPWSEEYLDNYAYNKHGGYMCVLSENCQELTMRITLIYYIVNLAYCLFL
jgi:uncharacterized protein YhbP (UPF0306 family)